MHAGVQRGRKELLKRYLLFVISLFFVGVGIALSKRAEMGISPVSAVGNVFALRFTQISFGTWLLLSNCVMLVGQIVLLRRRFDPVQLLQLPLSVIFGYFTDVGMLVAALLPNESYPMRLLLVLIGVAVLAFGISLSIAADVILNSGEALVKAIAEVSGKDFSAIKIVFDVLWVLLAVLLSLLLFEGRVVGTREGTVISAVLVGVFVRFYNARIAAPLERLLTK